MYRVKIEDETNSMDPVDTRSRYVADPSITLRPALSKAEMPIVKTHTRTQTDKQT